MAEVGKRKARALPRALAAAGRAASRARRRRIRRQARLYDRKRHLPRLIVPAAEWRALPEPALTLQILRRLARALRLSLALRARREWSYCPHRHEALLAAFAGEMLRLRKLS